MASREIIQSNLKIGESVIGKYVHTKPSVVYPEKRNNLSVQLGHSVLLPQSTVALNPGYNTNMRIDINDYASGIIRGASLVLKINLSAVAVTGGTAEYIDAFPLHLIDELTLNSTSELMRIDGRAIRCLYEYLLSDDNRSKILNMCYVGASQSDRQVAASVETTVYIWLPTPFITSGIRIAQLNGASKLTLNIRTKTLANIMQAGTNPTGTLNYCRLEALYLDMPDEDRMSIMKSPPMTMSDYFEYTKFTISSGTASYNFDINFKSSSDLIIGYAALDSAPYTPLELSKFVVTLSNNEFPEHSISEDTNLQDLWSLMQFGYAHTQYFYSIMFNSAIPRSNQSSDFNFQDSKARVYSGSCNFANFSNPKLTVTLASTPGAAGTFYLVNIGHAIYQWPKGIMELILLR